MSHTDPSVNNNSCDATEASVPIAATAAKVTVTKSHGLYDWCPLIDTHNKAVEGGNCFQIGIEKVLTKALRDYVTSNGLYSFFKKGSFQLW